MSGATGLLSTLTFRPMAFCERGILETLFHRMNVARIYTWCYG